MVATANIRANMGFYHIESVNHGHTSLKWAISHKLCMHATTNICMQHI